MKIVYVLAGLLALSGAALAKDSNPNGVTQRGTASSSPPAPSQATVISHSISVPLPVSSPRVGPISTGVITSGPTDETLPKF